MSRAIKKLFPFDLNDITTTAPFFIQITAVLSYCISKREVRWRVFIISSKEMSLISTMVDKNVNRSINKMIRLTSSVRNQ